MNIWKDSWSSDTGPRYQCVGHIGYLSGGLEPTVRIHLLGSQHEGTFERARAESRIFANAHRGRGARTSGRENIFDDPMDLTFLAPGAPHAESVCPPCGLLPARRGVSTVDGLDICARLAGCPFLTACISQAAHECGGLPF